jgi:sporulation protein YlmC with PRC-barrel domain
MLRKVFLCALASAAIIPASVLAQHGGGPGGGGPPGQVGGGMGNGGGFGPGGPGGMGGGFGGGFGHNGLGDTGITTRDQARMHSQGPAYASPNGLSRANQNGVLAGTTTARTVTRGPLVGLTNGTTLFSNGTAVGTVQQIRVTGNGSVAVVVVKGTNGGFYAVPANKLTLSGGMLSTNARFAGINNSANLGANSQARLNSQGLMHASPTGIAHASSRSVLASGAVVTGSLAGLTTGLTVNTSGGTTLGTVSQIVTGTDGSVRLVIVTSPTGQTFRLVPTTLSISGGVVTTTQIAG